MVQHWSALTAESEEQDEDFDTLPGEVLDALIELQQSASRWESRHRRGADTTAKLVDELVKLGVTTVRSLDLIWRQCSGESAQISERLSSRANALTSRLLVTYVYWVRQLEGDVGEVSQPWETTCICLMCLIRWRAKWSWSCYERPSEQFWVVAAYAYQNADRWGLVSTQCMLYEESAPPVSVEGEYLLLLFTQWVDPFCLSHATIFLLDRVATTSSDGLHLGPASGDPGREEIVDVSTGRLVNGAVTQPGSEGAMLCVPFKALRMRVESRLRELGEQCKDSPVLEATEQLARTVIGRKTRQLMRLGHRTSVVSLAHVCVGFSRIVDAETAALSRPSAAHQADIPSEGHECVVRDRSIQGCRLFVPLKPEDVLHIGDLLSVTGVYAGERSLGIVRWLNRRGSTDWDVGVWLLRGTMSVVRAALDGRGDGLSNKAEDFLVIDGGEESDGTVMGVLPKSAKARDRLVVPADTTSLKLDRFIESGYDFDLSVFKVENVNRRPVWSGRMPARN